MADKYCKFGAVGDKLKAISITKGLAESLKFKTVAIATGSGTSEAQKDSKDWWVWWAGLAWTGWTVGEIAKAKTEGSYDINQEEKSRGKDTSKCGEAVNKGPNRLRLKRVQTLRWRRRSCSEN